MLSLNILVFEDDPGIIRALRRTLEKISTVTMVDRYEDGIALLEVGTYDLIICDLNLATQRTGADVLAWLRANRPELVEHFVFHSSDDSVGQIHSRSVEKLDIKALRSLVEAS